VVIEERKCLGLTVCKTTVHHNMLTVSVSFFQYVTTVYILKILCSLDDLVEGAMLEATFFV
jgi:hypothetical protein